MIDDIRRTAVISACGRFRYRLGRRWDSTRPLLVFCMLNPSRANAEVDDPSATRCMRFAAHHGFGGIDIVNLFAYRATDPKDLAAAGFLVGEQNDEAIRDAAAGGKVVCLAWGAHASHPTVAARADAVLDLLRQRHAQLRALRFTVDGHPQHPLYLPSGLPLQPYPRLTIDEQRAQRNQER